MLQYRSMYENYIRGDSMPLEVFFFPSCVAINYQMCCNNEISVTHLYDLLQNMIRFQFFILILFTSRLHVKLAPILFSYAVE